MRMKWENKDNGTILNDLIRSNHRGSKELLSESFGDEEHEENDNETCRLNDLVDVDFSRTTSRLSIYKGIVYSSLSSLFFSLSSVIVKYLKDIHPGELAVCRFVGIFVLTLPLVVHSGQDPLGPKELRHYLILRGIAGSTNLLLRFTAIRYLPIGDASVIIFSVPVFVSVFAAMFLKEPCGVIQTVSVFLALIGLCLTTKLPILINPESSVNSSYLNNTLIDQNEEESGTLFSSERVYGIVSALSSTVFAASVYILIRKAKGAHHSVIMFNFGWVAIIETTIITALLDGFSMPKTEIEWMLIIVLGVFSFVGQILLTKSLQWEQAGPVSVVRASTDIALALLWQLWLFDEVPDAWSISGAFLVTICIGLTSVRKWILSLPHHSQLRRRLIIFTN